VADSSEWHNLSLRLIANRIAPNRKLHCIAVGIQNKKRFLDRRRLRVFHRAVASQLSFFRRARDIGKVFCRDFETVNHAFQRSRGIRRDGKILQRDAPTFVIRQSIEHDLRHFSV
jgi:hypothetical protein